MLLVFVPAMKPMGSFAYQLWSESSWSLAKTNNVSCELSDLKLSACDWNDRETLFPGINGLTVYEQ